MGGNTLKETYTRRYQKDEYFCLVDEVTSILTKEFPDQFSWIEVIPSYVSKEDYGDADILHSIDSINTGVIEKLFKPNQIFKNGSVISFDYKEFQIDLIYAPKAEFNYALEYFSFNDMGNLLGRMFKKLGFKHGHKGLLYVLRDGDHVVEELTVTTSYPAAIRLIGLEARYNFETLEDIFEYVASSPYFSPDIYLFENINHRSRVRDAKRSTYNKFLNWCKEYRGLKYHFDDEDKQLTLVKAFKQFPQFKLRYDAAMNNFILNKEVRRKFNGDIVMRLTPLRGMELGEFMTDFRDCHKSISLIDCTDAQLKNMILRHFKLYNERKHNVDQT